MKRLIDAARVRPATTVAVGMAGVALAAMTAFLIGGPSRTVAGSIEAPRMDIAVVAPVEPEVQPGDTMGVGELVDGFDSAALKTQADAGDLDPAWPQPAYVEDHGWDDRSPPAYSRPAYRNGEPVGYAPHAMSGADEAEHRPMIAGRGDRLGLGFDGPRPDYVAERHARLEAEARRQLAEARDDARGPGPGYGRPDPRASVDPASAFY